MFAREEGHEGPSFRGRRGPHGGRGPRGFGRPGGWQQADVPPAEDAPAWFSGRLPSDWYAGQPEISIDREEIIVTGELAIADAKSGAPGSTGTGSAETVAEEPAAAEGRLSRFREETRAERVKIADEAAARYGRKVSWGASIGETKVLFTHLSIPVMTRLRQPQRQVLDTLVDAGVARSRSEALAWAVDLVAQHTDDWLSGLRTAMAEVDKLRATGPQL